MRMTKRTWVEFEYVHCAMSTSNSAIAQSNIKTYANSSVE